MDKAHDGCSQELSYRISPSAKASALWLRSLPPLPVRGGTAVMHRLVAGQGKVLNIWYNPIAMILYGDAGTA